MKRTYLQFFLAATAALAVLACVREADLGTMDAEHTMTIRACVPEEPLTKASFSIPETGDGLHLAWKAGDQIRVINHADPSNHAAYGIQTGFSDHVALFSGSVVSGNTFDVLVPGSYTSVEAASSGNPALTQDGNNNTDHLVFTALLSNVAKADLADIGFTSAWVEAHPGTTLKRGGIVKFVLTLPAAVTAPKKVVLTGLGDEISVNITNVDLSSEHILTAYAQSGWEPVAIDPGTSFTVGVLDADGDYYAATKTVTAFGIRLEAGAQNTITIAGGFTEQLFAGGNGSQAAPYLIASAKHLQNMHVDGILEHSVKKYFRLIADIDMAEQLAATPWVPLNKTNPYDYAVDFDGDGHTIDHFSITTDTNNQNPQTGFFGVLYGDVHDLTFRQATVTNTYGKPTGILCGFCGYNGKPAHVYNVHVNGNVTFTYGSADIANADKNGPVGGLAGRIHTCVIESSSAFDMNIRSNKAYSGGLFGYDVAAGSMVRNCWTSGVIGGDNLGGQRIGGICGGLISQYTSIINCYSTMSVLNTYAMGGIAGHCNLDKNSTDPTKENHPTRTEAFNTIRGCIAWNDQITSHATDASSDHYSSGAIVGYTSTHSTLAACLRKASLSFTDFNSGWTPYDQENANAATPLVVADKGSSYHYHYPYHGKAFSGTLSAAASSLGWDTDVWDLSGSVPKLTGAVQADDYTSGASAVTPGSAGSGAIYPSAGNGWTVETVRTGIRYFHYDNASSYSGYTGSDDFEKCHQDVFVIDLDLNNPSYEVKLTYTSPSAACSQVFKATGAIAAVNAGYEKGSIALKANTYYGWTKVNTELADNVLNNVQTESVTDYPSGYGVSYMPNDYISDTGVPNWKSQGTVYFDGGRGVSLAFDGYDPAKAPGSSGNPPVKSVLEERLFYQLCTADKPGFVSSAPVLIENYNQVGKQFKNWYPKANGEPSEAPNTHQTSKYPRTAVALNADNHLLLVVCDGRYQAAYGGEGMSAYWLTQFLAKYFNPQYALNLDGGGSSTMCVENRGDTATHVVNYPEDNRTNTAAGHNHGGQRARDSFIVIVPKN